MQRQCGVSLVESLIALAVLAFGLIGVAAMQLTSLQSARAGYQTALVNVAAVDAQERVWAARSESRGCSDIAVGEVESAWKRHWVLDPETAVLPQINTALSGISKRGCRFTLRILLSTPLDQKAVEWVYEFQLPNGT